MVDGDEPSAISARRIERAPARGRRRRREFGQPTSFRLRLGLLRSCARAVERLDVAVLDEVFEQRSQP